MVSTGKMLAFIKAFGGNSAPSEVVILPETVMEYEAAYEGFPIRTEPNAKPEAGAVCLVTFNGKAYDCPAVVIPAGMGLTGFLFGNSDALGIPGGNTSAPFVVILYDSPIDDKGDGDFTHGLVSSMEELAEGADLTLSIVQEGAASGGASDSPVFVVKVSNSGGYTADKTYDETLAAMRAGKLVYFIVTAEGLIAATSLVSYFMDKIFATFDQTLNNQKLEWSADGSLKLKT